MKILVTTHDVSKRISPSNFMFLLKELAELSDLTISYEAGDIRDIIKHLGIKPDFILLNEYGEKKSPVITGLSSLKIPYAVYLFDLHYQIKERKKKMKNENVQYIFTHYRDKFLEWYPESRSKMFWLPHHVNTRIFKDYELKKDIDYLLMGSSGERVYPLREKIIKTMQHRPGFVFHIYHGHNNSKSVYVGKKFAREINRAKIFFTCDSVFHYPLQKYFEVLACKTLLLAPAVPELKDLGFIPGVHFVDINKKNFKEKAKYYLRHDRERLKITEQGYKLVHAKHTTACRAAQLLNMIEIIAGSYDR